MRNHAGVLAPLLFRPTRLNRQGGRRLRNRSLAVAALIKGVPTIAVLIRTPLMRVAEQCRRIRQGTVLTVPKEHG